ncbi:OmpH family outer membrane protein [Mesohalobacter salilacus]|uniref:OmpH family outer membrane protein n=1 Tax=Mesohalobacter salilacus TaxID=2491711 RepID=UPI00267C08CB
MSSSALAQRGLRVGYIDMDYILDNIPEYRQASQMLDQKIQDWKREITLKQTKIDNLKEQLENERPLLTPELIGEKEEEINYLQEQLLEYQETKFGASGEFIVQKRQLIQPIEDQVFNAVQEISTVREYDFIFEISAEALVLFAAERHDISDRVLKMINRSARDSRREKQKTETKEEQKNPLQEMAEEPYKSVKDAKADEEKEKERQEKISERERLRDSIREAREKVRDSIRNARQEAFEKRRQEAQRRRDSIRNARDNNKQ